MQDNQQPESKLTGKDLRALALWILAGVMGAAFAFHYFFAAFPEASVDFRVTRDEAVAKARQLLTEQGYDVSGYQSSVVFQVDQNAKTYLEREVGLEQANQLMGGEVNVWWWDVRFFRPRQQEEFRVGVDPGGRVVGMEHKVEEARAGAKLEAEAARGLAEEFLRRVGAGAALQPPAAASGQASSAEQRGAASSAPTGYEFLPGETNPRERPKRRDWSFTWERRIGVLEKEGQDAPYRVRVTVQGDRADGYQEFLKVPEAWERDFEKLRSSNIFFQILAQVPYAFLMGGVLLVLYDLQRRGLVNWKGALKLGLVLAALFFLMNVNEWPLTRHGYDTNTAYAGFLTQSLALAALSSVLVALLVAVTVSAGEPLYRTDHPAKLRLGAAFTRGSWREGVRSKEFFMATVIGLSLAAVHIAFVVAFYLFGKDVGFWAPQEVKYTDAVSTALPWIYPLAISLFAATSEEFTFRLFAIPLLLRLTKSKWAAVIVPAFVWGFLHSAYPQQPGWVRGVEVGIIGVVAGLVMLRWGILATLVWHYTVDALLIGLFLLRSESLYFRFSGGFVVALTLFPLLFAVGAYLVRWRFAAGEELFNRWTPPEAAAAEAAEAAVIAAPPEAAGEAAEKPLSAGLRALLVATAVLGAIAVVAMRPERIGDEVSFSINRGQAEERADKVLEGMGVKPGEFHRAAVVAETFNGVRSEYLRRQLGAFETRFFYEHNVPSVFWRVRYFKDAQKEEYGVVLRPDGGLHAVHHQLDEAAPGANLTKEEAQARAESWFLEAKMFDLSQWKLVEAESEKRPKRTDHTFTWEQIAGIGAMPGGAHDAVEQGKREEAAHVRFEIKVQGEEVSGYRIFVKIPEQWEREHEERTLAWIGYQIFRGVFFLAWGITVIVFFFRKLKQVQVAWGRLSRWALWGALAFVTLQVNNIPQVMATAYNTEFPLGTFIAVALISIFFVVGLAYSALFLLFGFGWFLLSRCFGEQRLTGWRGPAGSGAAWYCRDAVLLGVGGAGALALIGRFAWLLDQVWVTPKAEMAAASFDLLNPLWPASGAIADAVLAGLFAVGLVAVVAGSVASLGHAGFSRGTARVFQAGLIVLLAVVLVGQWGSAADFAKQALAEVAILALFVWGVARVFRFNMLGYFLLGVTGALAAATGELLQHSEMSIRWNGYVTAAAAIVFLAWPLVAARRASSVVSAGGTDSPLG